MAVFWIGDAQMCTVKWYNKTTYRHTHLTEYSNTEKIAENIEKTLEQMKCYERLMLPFQFRVVVNDIVLMDCHVLEYTSRYNFVLNILSSISSHLKTSSWSTSKPLEEDNFETASSQRRHIRLNAIPMMSFNGNPTQAINNILINYDFLLCLSYLNFELCASASHALYIWWYFI